jgi:DNA-binding MarR family transcriptional regulator
MPWSPLLAVQRATHHTLDLLSERLTTLGLTAAEINALATLADGRPRTISQLADDVGSKPTTMTSILDRLARRALITRREHPTSRRSVIVALTSAGARAAATVRTAVTELDTVLLEGLSKTEIIGLRRGLEHLSGRSS